MLSKHLKGSDMRQRRAPCSSSYQIFPLLIDTEKSNTLTDYKHTDELSGVSFGITFEARRIVRPPRHQEGELL